MLATSAPVARVRFVMRQVRRGISPNTLRPSSKHRRHQRCPFHVLIASRWLPSFRSGRVSSSPVPPNASAHAICFELGPVNFCFKWRHRDGSIIEFSPAKGWTSDDPMNTERLSKLNQLSSDTPVIPPSVLNWLQEECELIHVGALGSSPD
jgi:hypothetical protein